jgi:hypothetical protein
LERLNKQKEKILDELKRLEDKIIKENKQNLITNEVDEKINSTQVNFYYYLF